MMRIARPRCGEFLCVAGLSLIAAANATAPSQAAASSQAMRSSQAVRSSQALRPKQAGNTALEPCPGVPAYCGRLDRPLDPTGVLPGRISIHFELYLHTAPGKSFGTLVATEGGPGYPATGSREDYLALFKPLLATRDLLIMDNRGTGRSGALDCPALQTAEKWTVELVGACGESLGARASLYSTAYAADDLAAILNALGLEHIDLYGDSYGTYFEQVFAVRHPELLRSIVLDAAYPLNGLDYAWYPTYAPAMRAKFNIACERSPACSRWPGSSIAHIVPVLERLRSAPFRVRAVDSDGKERTVNADAAQLAIVMFGSAPAFATLRELDAAARAFLEEDRLPLLRLMAETIAGVDSRDPTADAAKWSAGLAAAVMCQDPPQIYDMSLPPVQRMLDRDRTLAERQRTFPDTYAPFTIDEYRAMPLDYAFLDQCIGWPVSPPNHPASQVVPADAAYPDVPALVISGELDNITTMAEGAAVAHLFRRGRQVRIANGLHVNALPRARSTCAAEIVRRFIATLDTGDTECASQVPPVRLVPRFATRVEQLEPALGLPGNSADRMHLQIAAAAVLTAGDVLARVRGNSTGDDRGLRGGRFHIAHEPQSVRITLTRVRWTDDLAVSGSVEAPVGPSGAVQAHLEVVEPGATAGPLTVRWQEGAADAHAEIRGTLGGIAVAAQTPAP